MNPLQTNIKIAIIGAGVSGLTAAMMLKSKLYHNVDIFERCEQAGGRINCKQIGPYKLDVGANLIDFNEQQLVAWNKIMPKQIKEKLRLLKKDFLIHENGKLEKGLRIEKYYYEGGFSHLIDDLKRQSEPSINFGSEITEISRSTDENGIKKFQLCLDTGKRLYDKIILAIPSPNIERLLSRSSFVQKEDSNKYLQGITQVKYTKQLTVCFKTLEDPHAFSCILFKNHPVLSFACSHQEKYDQPTIVVQLSEKFSEENFQESQVMIHDKVLQTLTETLPWLSGILKKEFFYIHKWPISLVVVDKKNVEALEMWRKDEGNEIMIIGDAVTGKSRVSGAVSTILKLEQKF